VDLESQANLEEDESAVIGFVAEHGGRCSRDGSVPGVYWLELRPRSQPAERYHVRVAWASYPHHAPSVKFATEIGGDTTSTRAWPLIPGYSPGNFICKPFTAEGYAAHSTDWPSAHPWVTAGNPFLYVVETLQADLDLHYQGRAA
jgi:hypothetical protein